MVVCGLNMQGDECMNIELWTSKEGNLFITTHKSTLITILMQCVCGTARLESGALQNYKISNRSKTVIQLLHTMEQ